MPAHEPRASSNKTAPVGADGLRLHPGLALSKDQGRLRRLQSRLREKPDDERLRAEFDKALAASVAARARRDANAPAPSFDDELPVAREALAILEAIAEHQV